MRSFRVLFFASLACVATCAAGTLVACVGDDPSPAASSTPDGDAAMTTTPGVDSSTPPEGDARTPESPDAADAGGDAAPKRFCATQAPLTGVTDFFCADFDGTSAGEGFTRTDVPDGGALTLVTDAFFSSPNALVTKNGATATYEKVGATPFLELDVDVRINVGQLGGVVPPSTGYETLVRLASIDSNVELRYTNGGMVEGAVYTGYYVTIVSCPSACALFEKKLSNQLPVNVWTDVQIAWVKTGDIKVTFNGLQVVDVAGGSTTSTKATATVGIVPSGTAPGVGRHAFDNFVVSVKR